MQLRVRPRDGEAIDLAVVDGHWAPPDGSELRDLSHGHAVAGLVDAHAHLSADELVLGPTDLAAVRERAWAAVTAGVFLCVDKGWGDDVVLRILADPPDRRPDLQAAGTMIAAPGGYYPDFSTEVDPADLPAAVARQAERSAGWVKVVGDWPRPGRGAVVNFDEEALRAAVRVAHEAGARVAVHAMGGAAGPAVAAGVDSVEHGLYLSADDVRALAARDGTWVPTIGRMEAVVEYLRPGSSGRAVVAEGLDNVRRLLPVASEAGLAVLPGSDLVGPVAAIAAEVVRLVEYGLPAAVAIDAATAGGMAHLGGGPTALVEGAPADVVVLAEDPVANPGTLLAPLFVMRHGRVLLDRGG